MAVGEYCIEVESLDPNLCGGPMWGNDVLKCWHCDLNCSDSDR